MSKGDVMPEQGESGRIAPREYSQDASEGPRKRSAAHERLAVFCGKWTATGSLGGGAAKPSEGRTTTEDEYKWLEGQFFLHHRGVMHLKDQSLESTAIIGFDTPTGSYRLHQFDNFGYARVYEGQVNGDVWTFIGLHERVTYTFGPGKDELRIVWEQTKDGRKWENLCDLRAHQVK
jgi:hypothetical protein